MSKSLGLGRLANTSGSFGSVRLGFTKRIMLNRNTIRARLTSLETVDRKLSTSDVVLENQMRSVEGGGGSLFY